MKAKPHVRKEVFMKKIGGKKVLYIRSIQKVLMTATEMESEIFPEL